MKISITLVKIPINFLILGFRSSAGRPEAGRRPARGGPECSRPEAGRRPAGGCPGAGLPHKQYKRAVCSDWIKNGNINEVKIKLNKWK